MASIARSVWAASKASPAADFSAKKEDASCLMRPSDGDGEFVKLVQLGLHNLFELPIPSPLKDVALIGEAEVVVFTSAELHDKIDAGKRFGVARFISWCPIRSPLCWVQRLVSGNPPPLCIAPTQDLTTAELTCAGGST